MALTADLTSTNRIDRRRVSVATGLSGEGCRCSLALVSGPGSTIYALCLQRKHSTLVNTVAGIETAVSRVIDWRFYPFWLMVVKTTRAPERISHPQGLIKF